MTDPSAVSPRQRILEAVVTCIEKDGFRNLTTRRIAEQAGTNIASINYYFRSKDLLVEEALAMTLQHMLGDIYDLLDQPGSSFPEALEEVFFYLIDGGIRFPETFLAHLYGALVEKHLDAPAIPVFHKMFERLITRAVQAYPDIPQENLRMALFQNISAACFMMLSPGFFHPVVLLNLSQPGAGRQLARYLTRSFITTLPIAL